MKYLQFRNGYVSTEKLTTLEFYLKLFRNHKLKQIVEPLNKQSPILKS